MGVEVCVLGAQGEAEQPMTEFRNSLTEFVTLVPVEPREAVSVPMTLTREAAWVRELEGVPQGEVEGRPL